MRFAFISTMDGSPWGGSEELWSQTAIQLKRSGHEVQATVVKWPHISDRVALLTKHGISVHLHPSYRSGGAKGVWDRFTFGLRRSYSRLKRFNPDLVVISQGHNSGGFECARVCREAAIPYVIIVHCNSELWWFQDRSLTDAAASYKAARKVFCVSRGNLNLLRMQLGDPLQNGEIVWNPFKVSTQDIPVWPDESGWCRMACVGRLDPAAKGQELILQVLARPEWRARPVELSFFGEGPYELTLRSLAEMLTLNNIRFRGQVGDIRSIWNENHLLVLPSRYEGLPLVLVEAMWCGRPSVVTDVGGNAEICVDGETGFVAPAPTVLSLANALERAWERRSEWRQMGQAARARAKSQIPENPIALFSEQLERCAFESRR
jgi:glycosyltransferase involved in cell wall biosynthesis